MKNRFMVLAQSALLAAGLAGNAIAEEGFDGAITKGNLSVWRIDSSTGRVSLCSFEGLGNKPDCYPWSATQGAGHYRIIAGDDVLSTWRMNSSNGKVSLCEYDDVGEPPRCSPWSDGAK